MANKGVGNLLSNGENGFYTEDFIGFTFNGVHSSTLNIVRTSNGDRFDDNLSPDFDSTTVEVEGMDGTLFFGGHYTKKSYPLDIAFDSVTEEQLSKIQNLFSDRKVRPLILDETPYKTYYVTIDGSATIHYIPFDVDGERVYKGEGNIPFITYTPFARSTKKFLDEYNNANKNQWARASKLLSTKGSYDSFDANGLAHLYNAGDVEAPFYYVFPVNGYGREFVLTANNQTVGYLKTYSYSNYSAGDTHIRFNFDLCIIEGGKMVNGVFVKSGNIYNQTIEEGDFFKIPLGYSNLTVMNTQHKKDDGAQIIYDYLYY